MINDPAKDEKDSGKRKSLRKSAWKRPSTKAQRDKLREERLKDWRDRHVADNN